MYDLSNQCLVVAKAKGFRSIRLYYNFFFTSHYILIPYLIPNGIYKGTWKRTKGL